MNDKIRVVCNECEKKLGCPASAAGRKAKCPACGTAIRVPDADRSGGSSAKPTPKKRGSAGQGATQKRRRAAADSDDPYQSTVPGKAAGLPPRSKKAAKNRHAKSAKSKGGDQHWSRRMIVGIGIMGASIASNAFQLAIQGPPNMRTAEGKGQAFGQAFVTIGGLIFGLVIVIRSWKARRSDG